MERILASTRAKGGAVTDAEAQVLKYCTKVKYLDLGHNEVLTDISFAAYMPELEVAIFAINDIDDMVHGQQQGRIGMYQDIQLWAKERKLLDLIDRLLAKGFKVYLTADHGNTACVGVGSCKRSGVETATKSKRMIILKDFAQVQDDLAAQTFVYPGFYSDKSYQYRICNDRTSFDSKNTEVMTHGGISLEEVVVPFVEVRKKNG